MIERRKRFSYSGRTNYWMQPCWKRIYNEMRMLYPENQKRSWRHWLNPMRC